MEARTGLCHSVIGEEADMSNEVDKCRGEEERNIQCTSFLRTTEQYRTEFHTPVSRGSCHSVDWSGGRPHKHGHSLPSEHPDTQSHLELVTPGGKLNMCNNQAKEIIMN